MKKETLKNVIFVIVLLTVILILSCYLSKPARSQESRFRLEDFLPMEVGRSWTYDIMLSDSLPAISKLNSGVLFGSPGKLVRDTREYLPKPDEKKQLKNPQLVLRVKSELTKGTFPQWFPPDVQKAVEISIDKDDIGVYHRAIKVFWVIAESENAVLEIRTYPPVNVGSFYSPDGLRFSQRIILFFPNESFAPWESPVMQNVANADIDNLGLLGKLPDSKNPTVVFRRKVLSREKKENDPIPEIPLDKAFSETMLFEKGEGLVFLLQNIDDVITMGWKLKY